MNINFTTYGKLKTTGGVPVYFNYSKMTATLQEPTNGLRENLNTGQRFGISKMHRATVQIFIHLHKENDPATKWATYLSHYGTEVYLYPDKDGDPFQNEWGEEMLFTLKDFNTFFDSSSEYRDLLILTFQSNENVDMSHKGLTGYGTDYATIYGGGF